MATLKEIIDNIKNIRAGGTQTDDIKMSDANMAFIIDYYRAKRIRQDIDRGKTINPDTLQMLEDWNVTRFKMQGRSTERCLMYKTTLPVPKAVETNKNNLITFVGKDLFSSSFQRTTFNKLPLDLQRGVTRDETKWFENGNHIYVATQDSMQKITIQGVFEHPVDILKANNSFDIFRPYDFEYPVSTTILDDIYKMMVNTEMKLLMMIPNDIVSDGQETKITKDES